MLGPKVTTHRSCFDCEVCVSESYRVQSDSGQDVYCTHPSLAERKRIGDTNWETPDWCPAAIAAAPQFAAPEEVAPARYKGSEHIVPLADCPMCASETDFVEIGGFWTAECSECGLALCDYSSRLDLCNDWNRRAASQFIATEVNDAMCERVWDAVFRKVVSNEVMAELRHAALFLDAWRSELGPQLGLASAARITELETAITVRETEIARLKADLELARVEVSRLDKRVDGLRSAIEYGQTIRAIDAALGEP